MPVFGNEWVFPSFAFLKQPETQKRGRAERTPSSGND